MISYIFSQKSMVVFLNLYFPRFYNQINIVIFKCFFFMGDRRKLVFFFVFLIMKLIIFVKFRNVHLQVILKMDTSKF